MPFDKHQPPLWRWKVPMPAPEKSDRSDRRSFPLQIISETTVMVNFESKMIGGQTSKKVEWLREWISKTVQIVKLMTFAFEHFWDFWPARTQIQGRVKWYDSGGYGWCCVINRNGSWRESSLSRFWKIRSWERYFLLNETYHRLKNCATGRSFAIRDAFFANIKKQKVNQGRTRVAPIGFEWNDRKSQNTRGRLSVLVLQISR
jgi:hypothetical protein